MDDKPKRKRAPRARNLRDRTPADLARIAVDCVEGRIFGSWMLPKLEDSTRHFLPLWMGPALPANVGHVFEYMHEAFGTLNGRPMFHSCHMLTKNDVAVLDKMVREAHTARQQLIDKLVTGAEK